MSVSVTCRACGARLKLPPGSTKKKARCPKCNARIDLTAALDAAAYQPDSVAGLSEVSLEIVVPPPTKPNKPAKAAVPPPVPASRPTTAPPPIPAKRPTEREEDPLPYAAPKPGPKQPTPAKPPPLPKQPAAEAPLTLDDDPPAPGTAPAPSAAPPFRTQARVTDDSAKLFVGPCEVVLVPHGMFLESVPYRPFLYAPLRSKVEPEGCGFTVTLPDRRVVAIEFVGANASQIAEDAAAFLAGERPLPDANSYRRNPKWLLWLALIFALGLAVGPLVLSQTTKLGLQTGLMIAGGFAVAGLLANAAVVLLTRMSVPGKVATMASIGVLVTGVFLFAATAYLAGRKEAEQAEGEPPPSNPGGTPQPAPKPPDSTEPPPNPRRRLPSAVDAAYRDGVFRFEEGPDDVTSIAVTNDGAVMLVGYKNGATKVWRFDQLTVDPFTIGPKADGPVSRIQFDGTLAIAYLTCTGGTVAAYWNDPPEIPVKIPGDPFAAFTFPSGERFAAYRGNALTLRYVPTVTLRKPPPKAKGFATLTPKDEVQPADVKAQLTPPNQRPTFLAWHPTGKLLGGLPDGSILSWGTTGPTSTVISRDHKGPVRAWASAPSTWDFATGDDKGVVGLWPNKSLLPRTFTGASGPGGAAVAITHLVFSPSGSHLAVADAANFIWVWDLSTMRSILKHARPSPLRAIAWGPNDDLLILSDNKAIDMWHLAELQMQP